MIEEIRFIGKGEKKLQLYKRDDLSLSLHHHQLRFLPISIIIRLTDVFDSNVENSFLIESIERCTMFSTLSFKG